MCRIKSGIILDEDSLNQARRLLYKSYVQELRWNINPDNYSHIKIVPHQQKMLLVDDYDELSLWFYVKQHQEMVACARLCFEDTEGLLEVERYPNAQIILKPILQQKRYFNLIELNREAILSCNVEQDYALYLLREVFQYCLAHNHTLLTTCNLYDWVGVYDLIGFKPLENYQFKYHDNEPLPVKVYLATPDDIERFLVNINCQLKYYAYKTRANWQVAY